MIQTSIRDQFAPAREGRIYLNHSGVSPLPQSSVDAMTKAIERFHRLGAGDYDDNVADLNACRRETARLINAHENEIALTRNTTDGVNWIANGFDWNAGDRVVSIDGEYPATIYPFMRLEPKGVELHLIEPQDGRIDYDALVDALATPTRMLAVSWVQFITGFRLDLERVGRLCAERDVLFLVDVIQGLGALPLDVKAAKISVATGGSQKWMLGPQGAGFMYIAPEWLDRIEPTQVGSDSVASIMPYSDYDLSYRDGARRFEYSTLPAVPLIGMGASAKLLNESGPAAIEAKIHSLTCRLVEGLGAHGWRCHSPRGESEWSGIVSFTHPNIDPDEGARRLADAGAFAMKREGYLRLAPHFYQTDEEMETAIDALKP